MKRLLLFIVGFSCCTFTHAQENKPAQKDTFFLAKKKGILGRIGRSLSRNADDPVKPRLTVEEFKPFYGKIIRHIIIKPVGFDQKMGDTARPGKGNIFTRAANAFHLNSTEELIKKNLFFKEGQPFYPLHAADNERYLRTLDYLRDALIKVVPVEEDANYIDILVFTRDVFSIGGSAGAPKTEMRSGTPACASSAPSRRCRKRRCSAARCGATAPAATRRQSTACQWSVSPLSHCAIQSGR